MASITGGLGQLGSIWNGAQSGSYIPVTGSPQQVAWYPSYPTGISETQSKHIHVDLALIDWKDITIIKNGQKVTMTPEELAIKLGLEW